MEMSNTYYLDKIEQKVEFKIALSQLYEIETKKQPVKEKLSFKIMEIAACLFILITTGIVFAKDISKLFNNSNNAIESAVENEYVQEEIMNYVYDKDIGIKVNDLILDDLNLDISYDINLSKENTKMVRPKDFSITNDNNKIVYTSESYYAETIEDLPLYNSMSWDKLPIKIDDNTYRDSILIGLRPDYKKFNTIYINISSMQVIYGDDSSEIIDGTWNITINISDEMKQNSTIIYNMVGENDYIENCTLTMSKTGAIINLDSKAKIPTSPESGYEIQTSMLLKSDTATYPCGWLDFNETKMTIHYDNVGSFIEKSDVLELELGFFDTTIILEKQ